MVHLTVYSKVSQFLNTRIIEWGIKVDLQKIMEAMEALMVELMP